MGSSKIHRAKERAERIKSSHECNFILKTDKLKIAPPIFRSPPRAFSAQLEPTEGGDSWWESMKAGSQALRKTAGYIQAIHSICMRDF